MVPLEVMRGTGSAFRCPDFIGRNRPVNSLQRIIFKKEIALEEKEQAENKRGKTFLWVNLPDNP
jgi:hypothetical protein